MSEPLAVGTPNWVDLATPDVNASRDFYAQVMGWTSDEGDPQFGGYTMFKKDGKLVAGVGPLQEGQPPAWSTYVRSANVDDTAARVTAGGGTVVAPPMQIGDAGRMLVFQDPTGGFCGAWENGQHTGMELWNKPGSVAWNEFATRDLAKAEAFYRGVFDWDAEGDDNYRTVKTGDRPVCGMMPMPEGVPAEVPSFWMTYFLVDDLAAATRRLEELGGQRQMGPTESPFGPFSVVRDPNGAVFSIMELKESTQA